MKQICIYLRGRLSTAFLGTSLSSRIFNMWNALCFLFTSSIRPLYWHIFHTFSTFMRFLGAGDWPKGRVPTYLQTFTANLLSHTYSLDTATCVNTSVNRARQRWTWAPPVSWWGVFSTEAEGLKDLGNPFRFGGKEADCQILFPWPCNT